MLISSRINILVFIYPLSGPGRRSQWPRRLRRRYAVARLLRLWIPIPPGKWTLFVVSAGCVLSGRGPCDELITHPEESYRLCCVVVCDLEPSWMRRSWPTGGCRAKNKQSGSGSLVVIATAYGLDGPGIEYQWGEIFRTCPDRPWGPPSLLYNGCRVFPEGKERLGRDTDPSPPSSAVVMKG